MIETQEKLKLKCPICPPSVRCFVDECKSTKGCSCLNLNNSWDGQLAFQDEMFKGWDNEWTPSFISNALAGEGGEFTEEMLPIDLAVMMLRKHVAQGKVANLVKKLDGGGTNRVKANITPEKALEELVDDHIYSILLVKRLGFTREDFSKALAAKIAKNYERMKVNRW